ncbi:MAG TPA: asparaginase [Gemmatimonadales bacterium]|nr:asparaginase [Gemmatimonadales bacterium]
MSSLLIEARRGPARESLHRVSVAVMDAAGNCVAWNGDRGFPTFLRSAAKPFQAMPLVADGVVERFAITGPELALATASHNSEARQVAIVRGLLERIGCAERDLACGPHRPLALDLAVPRTGDPVPGDLAPASPIASNCSGKHTGMLAVARAHGWPVAGYQRSDHPVQQRCREEVARWCGVRASEMAEGTDGCGVVSFQVPLDRLATAFARFGVSDEPAGTAVRGAMLAHPDLVAGRNRLCTELMAGYPGEVIAKVGADGVYGLALPRRGLGVGLKVEDGHGRATMAALIAVLDQLGLTPPPSERLPRFARFPVLNTRGAVVGELAPSGTLTFE